MPSLTVFLAWDRQEPREEEHLSWIKDGNVHWMEIFNYWNGFSWLKADRKAAGAAEVFDKRQGEKVQSMGSKRGVGLKKFFPACRLYSQGYSMTYSDHTAPILVLFCTWFWAFTLHSSSTSNLHCGSAFHLHFIFKLDQTLMGSYTSLPTASCQTTLSCFHQWL